MKQIIFEGHPGAGDVDIAAVQTMASSSVHHEGHCFLQYDVLLGALSYLPSSVQQQYLP